MLRPAATDAVLLPHKRLLITVSAVSLKPCRLGRNNAVTGAIGSANQPIYPLAKAGLPGGMTSPSRPLVGRKVERPLRTYRYSCTITERTCVMRSDLTSQIACFKINPRPQVTGSIMNTPSLISRRNPAIRTFTVSALLFLTAASTLLSADQHGLQPVTSGGASGQFTRREYLIGPGDQLEIRFFYNPELNETVTVDPGGSVSLQLIGQVQAMGLTSKELESLLASRYESQLAKPQPTVLIKSFAREKVFVQGEVERPGVFELAGNMTVLQAIATAGGLKETAKEKDILVIRFPHGSGTPSVIRADLRSILRGREPVSDLVLAPMDVIYVSRSHIANVNLWVDQHVRKNIPITAGILSGVPF